MNYSFEPLVESHRIPVIDIYNHYIENGFAAYPEKKVPYEFFDNFLEKTKGYPAFSILNDSTKSILGFCFLKPYHPFPVFKETVEITYFIEPIEVGKGIGKKALQLLEDKGRIMGIKQILASISSLNEQSIAFHRKNGFKECGRFHRIINKNGIRFDIVWMQKELK
ncbi:MAG: N-acetyltransferase family protein [Bacteroidales bacterium]|nr:MAG: N-acetyltransferase family protein [Bacteroidales bacterium]